MNLAPIALFVFERPELTLKTLESLKKNELSKSSNLFVFADGPKPSFSAERLSRINETIEVVKSKKWCKEVSIIQSNSNKGLRASIISGVTKLCNEYGRVIVLEDDLELSPFFLNYMNDALEMYKDSNKVYHISGHVFDVGEKLPQTFFHSVPHSWGWATWQSKWEKFNPGIELNYKEISPKKEEFNLEGSYNFFRQIKGNYDGTLNTWAVFWYASIFLNKGICLTPGKTFVRNIGFGKNATHTKYSNRGLLEIKELSDKIELVKQEEKLDLNARRKIIKNFKKNKNNIFMKIAKFIYFDVLFYFRRKNR